MDLTQYKIDQYANGVSNLPDYPSDEGYTADQLKAVFDVRSDNEIKRKHNELIDAIITAFSSLEQHVQRTDNPHAVSSEQTGAEKIVEAHDEDNEAHSMLFDELRNELAEAFSEKVDKVSGKGLSTNDFTDKEKAELSELTKHKASLLNPHNVTAEQIGVYTKKEIDAMIGEIGTELDTAIAVADAYIDDVGISTDSTGTYVTLAAFAAHVNNTSNPHNVTAEQVGVSVDLAGYATEEYVDTAIEEAVLDSWEAEV